MKKNESSVERNNALRGKHVVPRKHQAQRPFKWQVAGWPLLDFSGNISLAMSMSFNILETHPLTVPIRLLHTYLAIEFLCACLQPKRQGVLRISMYLNASGLGSLD